MMMALGLGGVGAAVDTSYRFGGTRMIPIAMMKRRGWPPRRQAHAHAHSGPSSIRVTSVTRKTGGGVLYIYIFDIGGGKASLNSTQQFIAYLHNITQGCVSKGFKRAPR